MKLFEKLKNLNSLTIFLVLECLAITSFALGGINIVFYCFGIVISILCIFQSYQLFERKELINLLIFFIPIFLLSIFISFGKLLSGQGITNIILLLGFNSFFIIGICSRKIPSFNKETALLVIGFSIALLVLISMVYSWVNYGFFYVQIYKDTPIYYYDAIKYDITKEGGFLIGFSFKEVSLLYSGGYGLFLSIYLVALLFINPKQNLKKFLMFLSIGLVGLIYLITIVNVKALFFFVLIFVFAILYRFLKDKRYFYKTIKIIFVSFYVLLIVFFLIMVININNETFASFISNNAFLNRIFNTNRIVYEVNIILKEAFKEYNLLGFVDSSLYYDTQQAIFVNSGMFEIELIKESGIFALFLLILIVPLYFIFSIRYLKDDNDNNMNKIITICLLFGLFIYFSFENDIAPIIHEPNEYMSFFRNPLTLILIFLLGSIYNPIFKKEALNNEIK